MFIWAWQSIFTLSYQFSAFFSIENNWYFYFQKDAFIWVETRVKVSAPCPPDSYFQEIITFIFKWIKVTVKAFVMLKSVCISNKCFLSFLYSILDASELSLKCQAAQLFSILIIINISWADIRMISERSCDTEDWSNDAENPALK